MQVMRKSKGGVSSSAVNFELKHYSVEEQVICMCSRVQQPL